MEPECNIKVADFEGPLDLLLYLINRNRLEITDIPIALVTRQYLDYIEIIKALNVAVAGEYLVMAATLIQIKSRMLLPVQESCGAEDDPRLEITGPLQELAAARRLAGHLSSMPMLGREVFFSGLATKFGLSEDGSTLREEGKRKERPPLDMHLSELIAAMERVLACSTAGSVFDIREPEISLASRMEYVRERLVSAGGRLDFFDLFGEYGRRLVIVTFLALLELVKESFAMIFQDAPGANITIMLRENGSGQ